MPGCRATSVADLLYMCRAELGTGCTAAVSLESERWRSAVSAAREHGLIGPVYTLASTTHTVPPDVLTSIRKGFLTQAAHNFQLTHAFFEILDSFRRHNTETLVLKGIGAALFAFGHLTTRESTDLDLLVRPDDLERAKAALIELGYSQVTNAQPELLCEKDVQFVRDSDDLLVEVHWAVTPRSLAYAPYTDRLWNNARTIRCHDILIPTLGPEDTFLTLCIHGCKHGWYSLKWVYDIARILVAKSHGIDWQGLIQQCEREGCLRTVIVAVCLARILFDVRLPEPLVDRAARDTHMANVAEAIAAALLSNRKLSQRELIAVQIQVHDRLIDRLFAATSVSVPELPRLLPQAASPITQSPLRFLTRPVRLLKLYGFRWFRAAVLGK